MGRFVFLTTHILLLHVTHKPYTSRLYTAHNENTLTCGRASPQAVATPSRGRTQASRVNELNKLTVECLARNAQATNGRRKTRWESPSPPPTTKGERHE